MAQERHAFRELLRIARAADRQPARLAALLGRPPRLFDASAQRVVHVPAGEWPFVDDVVRDASGGSTEYAHPKGTAARAVRRHYGRARDLGLPYLAEARALTFRLEPARLVAARLGLAARPARRRAKLPSRPQVSLARLSPDDPQPLAVGDFLLCHPISGLFEPMFDMSVVVIVRVDSVDGTTLGLVLNKPGDTLAKFVDGPLTLAYSNAAGRARTKTGPEELLFQGGPNLQDGPNEGLLWLHTLGDLVPGSIEVAPTVFLGAALSSEQALARSRTLRAESEGLRLLRGGFVGARFFHGFCAWTQAQLEIELERGVWIRARGGADAARALCFGAGDSEALWRAAIAGAGMQMLARWPRGSRWDPVLRSFVESHQRARAAELMSAQRPAVM